MIRYPQHRPEGLVVDATGKVELSNLMSVWASAEGLTETHILDTVEAHKWQDTETMTPRYSLLGEDGSFQIRVHKPRRELQQRKSMPSKPRSTWLVKSEGDEDRRRKGKFTRVKSEPNGKKTTEDPEAWDSEAKEDDEGWEGYNWAKKETADV
ncbi:unnamed protein product [Symbiodinium microadriaticum]|nr:unnamed protein product [Symbiodinium microadriaticum]CAE7948219.1 unnamed protein product [Symbiodinium sp. KB8]